MDINELYRPKIGKNVASPILDYFSIGKNPYTYDVLAKKTLDISLKNLGWKYLNSGVYSSVYMNPQKSFVLKINNIPDTGYKRYVNIIKSHRNKHFPIISDMKSMQINKRLYYVYLIEKLFPIPNAQAERYEQLFDTVFSYTPTTPVEEIFPDGIPILFKKQPTLLKALHIVDQYSKNRLDLHSKNFMRRLDGTIVITDPYV